MISTGLIRLFLSAIFYSILGLMLARWHFNAYEQIITSTFIALGLYSIMQQALERNRCAIWDKENSALRANETLAAEVVTIFFGIFVVGLMIEPNAAGSRDITAHFLSNSLVSIYRANAAVLWGGAFIAIFFGPGGLVFLLAWNALNWAGDFSYMWSHLPATASKLDCLLGFLAVLPHLVFELVAYILAGLSGVFFSKAIGKYALNSDAFARVSKACLVLFLVGAGSLLIAGLFENYVGLPFIRLLQN